MSEGSKTYELAVEGLSRPFVQVIETQRSIRRLLPDPVDDRILLRLIELATKAPTGSNAQNWEFVLVKDHKKKRALQDLYGKAWRVYGSVGRRVRRDERTIKIMKAVQYQIDHFEEVPVVVVACLRGWRLPFILPQPSVAYSTYYGSIYPAVQNLLLGARAVGLGAGVVTLPLWNKWAIKRLLRLPLSVEPICLIPMGWPKGRYGPTTRKPVTAVTHVDTYGNRPFESEQ
ncbi:MAG: nitroreductase [Acidimicrobiia bacterium]